LHEESSENKQLSIDKFTNYFYINLFKEKFSVCKSFYDAVIKIDNDEDENI
jgi:hypothetical protein